MNINSIGGAIIMNRDGIGEWFSGHGRVAGGLDRLRDTQDGHTHIQTDEYRIVI